jgi:hypothetical protein
VVNDRLRACPRQSDQILHLFPVPCVSGFKRKDKTRRENQASNFSMMTVFCQNDWLRFSYGLATVLATVFENSIFTKPNIIHDLSKTVATI